MSCNCNGCADLAAMRRELDQVIREHKDMQGSLIPVLHEAQRIFGYLPLDVQKQVAEGLEIPLAEVYGVVSFYTGFSTKPKGKYKINVCLGTACYVKGSEAVLDKFKAVLGLNAGDCTEDRKFSLDACRCIGACGLAPAVMINDDVYGNVTPDDVENILNNYSDEEEAYKMIKTIAELNALREVKKEELEIRFGGSINPTQKDERMHILVCGVAGCQSSGSLKVAEKLERILKENNLEGEVKLVKTGCMGLCAQGLLMVTYPDKVMYTKVKPEDVEEIFEKHIMGGEPVSRLIACEADGKEIENALENHSFYSKQMKIALKNCGRIDPYNIEEYIGCDGYQALAKVLREMEPEDVIDEMKASNLRGRGGAGFPTGVKWAFAASQQQRKKYVCCNADEGDPGAFMDRSVLEGDPHSVLEAMAIAGYAIGSDKGYIYVRAEYPVAVKTLKHAIAQAKEYGLLGKNILGKGFNFDIEVRLGAGAFVCGEETALMTSIEGKRGEPRPRPPFPAVKGLFGQPTILNNVETYATIPRIFLNGAEWFNSIGTEKSKGTKVFAVGGKIARTGLVEVPMGTTLREIVYDMCGGIPKGKAFKAAQTGGPSGGCIPASALDTPIDYDNLIQLGSMMGSGGLIVMDEDTCMVDLARFFLDFTVDESCGKCSPCRIGTRRMLEILTKITEGKGTLEDIDNLEVLAKNIKNSALCGLGQTAPNPVLSTLRYFRDEYIAHVVDKKCPAGVCKSIVRYKIDPDTCKRCGICMKHCPVGAISGDKKTAFTIDQNKCIKCGLCMEKCPFKSILRNA